MSTGPCGRSRWSRVRIEQRMLSRCHPATRWVVRTFAPLLLGTEVGGDHAGLARAERADALSDADPAVRAGEKDVAMRRRVHPHPHDLAGTAAAAAAADIGERLAERALVHVAADALVERAAVTRRVREVVGVEHLPR